VAGPSKILVVEDNDELRELASQLVEGLGYSVCSASTGAEAIATFAKDPKIDILFTDVLMPGGMNGFELAVEIRRTRPEVAILVTSGFPGNLLPSAQQHGGFEMIPKPFTQAELAAALAKSLRDRYYFRNTNSLSIRRRCANSNGFPKVSGRDPQRNARVAKTGSGTEGTGAALRESH
jgi:CheY-like chemotaxis protein